MNKALALFTALVVSAPAWAGNLDTFVEPEEVEEAAPMGGSNAAWIIPLIAIIAIAAAASSDDDEEEETPAAPVPGPKVP